MKKILSLLLIFILSGTLIGCSSSIPEGMSKTDYENGEKLLDIINEYIDENSTVNDVFFATDSYSAKFEGDDENTADLKKIARDVEKTFEKSNPRMERVKEYKTELEKALGK